MKLYNLTVAQTYCYLPTNKTLGITSGYPNRAPTAHLSPRV